MRQRVITAVVLAPIVLAIVACTSPWPIFALGVVAGFLCLEETRRMLRHRIPSILGAAGYLLLSELFLSTRLLPRVSFVTLIFFLAVVGVLASYRSASRSASTYLGSQVDGLWPSMPLVALLTLHQSHLHGGLWQFASPVLLVLIPVWAGDIAAIFAGKALGKHPLAPAISPKKTWEGSIANLLAASAFGLAVGVWLGLGPMVGLGCGVAAGVLGQVGDLFESYVKRRAGMKDSGTLLPGHGGLMDRIDSLLFVAPVVALILALVPR